MIGCMQLVEVFASHSMVLFSDIHKLKINRKCADHSNRLVKRQAREQSLETSFGSGGMRRAELFAEAANLLFNLKKTSASKARQCLAEQITEPANIRSQRCVFRVHAFLISTSIIG